MTFAITLHAATPGGIRSFADAWTHGRRFASVDYARAWLGTNRVSLAEMLTEDEPYFVAAIGRPNGSPPKRVFFVARDWPHDITCDD